MARAARLGALLLLAIVAGCTALAGCTAGTTVPGAGSAPTTAGSATAAGAGTGPAAAAGADVGNARPHVTHDGLMVRRRVVIAILPTPGADDVVVRRELDRAAAARHTSLADISPSVLDPADQERLAPHLTVLLPAGATRADALDVVDPTGRPGAALPGVRDYTVAPVLVHDLRFAVRTHDPSTLMASLAREGILADALGSYSAVPGHGRLEVAYTGPLLSDELVEAVRRGIARGEGVPPTSVTVAPRSSSGVGVDLAREPEPAPVVEVATAPHGHGAVGHGAVSAATTVGADAPAPVNVWVVAALAAVGIAGAVWLGIILVRQADEEPDNS